MYNPLVSLEISYLPFNLSTLKMTTNDIYQSLSFVFLIICRFWISTSDSCSRPPFLHKYKGVSFLITLAVFPLQVSISSLYLILPPFGTNSHDAFSDGHSCLYLFYSPSLYSYITKALTIVLHKSFSNYFRNEMLP